MNNHQQGMTARERPVASSRNTKRAMRLWCSLVLTILSVPAGVNAAQALVEDGPSGTHGSEQGKPKIDVNFTAGLLSVEAKDTAVKELFKVVGEKAGLDIILDPTLDEVVTMEFKGQTPEAGIRKILDSLKERNYSVRYLSNRTDGDDGFTIEKIKIVKKVGGKKPSDAEILDAVQKRDKEYRELFDKLDNERNKIARALRELVDPETSPDKKNKLRTFLRQTSIHEPEDKKLLMGVSVDPQYKELRSELDMALLHAIQERPEESDKEYILYRWREKIPLGWLLYAMLKVWDDRYIPYLLEAVATTGDFYCIEILGRANVEEAVPYLELALKHKSAEARKAAYYALLHITGKEYKYLPVLKKPAAPQASVE